MAIYLSDPPHGRECSCCRHWRDKIEKLLEALLAETRKGIEMGPRAQEYHSAQADGFPNGDEET